MTAHSFDSERLAAATVASLPFPYVIVPGFLTAGILDEAEADFPHIDRPGSFPLRTLRYGPAFARLIAALTGPEMTTLVSAKLGIDLAGRPTMVTVRGQSRASDGKIHADSRSKLVTMLLYMNNGWNADRGRLRILRSADNLDDFAAEVSPDGGTLLLFRNGPTAWHGFEPFEGPRRLVQVNWVTDAGVVRREEMRHSLSAFFKRIVGKSVWAQAHGA